MAKGYLALVLHAHLPFVRHPEYEDFLEERWLYEAITETYIPLYDHFRTMLNDGVRFRLTMSLTPPLVSMLTDGLLQDRYARHIEKLIELARKEVVRTQFQPEFRRTAERYLERFELCRRVFNDECGRNLVAGFRRLQDAGVLEIITCGATHGFLPLLNPTPEAVRAQVLVAAQHYEEHFGRPPRGIWLPECGYYPGVEEFLKEAGLRFFFVDTHGLLLADRRPQFGVFAPVYCPNGVAAFGRDPESSKSVWSSEEGYPGDFEYREFYRDIGYDLPMDYIRPYIHDSGLRVATGIKYYKITQKGSLEGKQPYDWDRAREKAAIHAGNFLFNRERQVEYLNTLMGERPPIIVSPYDAELFGHWWFEGPDFLNFLIRKIAYDQETIELISPLDYLERHPRNQVAQPSFSSWGDKGYAEVWLNGSNDWIYRHLHKAAERMVYAAGRWRDPDPLTRRVLNQMARELLLAQSSDWAFIMTTNTMVDYAIRRTKEHTIRFNKLFDMLEAGRIEERYVAELEARDNIFPNLDYRVYQSRPAVAETAAAG
ncbi:MAG: glycoside hydrolase family 57 protein [Candidatus Sumerlaeia bacterium]